MTPIAETSSMRTSDGRTITWCEIGDRAGQPVLAAHGSPGSRFQLLPLHDSATAAGLRIITPDRPGFGGTDPGPDRRLHSWDDDAMALLDYLELAAVPVLGFSGGGPYALALAAAHPQRVTRLVLACGMIPGAPRRTRSGRLPLISTLYLASLLAPGIAVAMLEGRGPFRNTREANIDGWPEADRRVMTDPHLTSLTALDAAESVRQGARAGVTDLARFFRRLPEPLSAITQRVTLLHGTADVNVPIEIARWAASELPRAVLHELADAGHYFAASHPELVTRALVE